MRLVPRLTLAFVLGSGAILAANGYFRVRREVSAFEVAHVRDQQMIGRALAASTGATWESEGEEVAMEAVRAANQHFDRFRISWRSSSVCPAIEAGDRRVVSTCEDASSAPAVRRTFVGLPSRGRARGGIEVVEILGSERSLAKGIVIETIKAAVALAFLSAVLSLALGQWLVGKPVAAIVDKARRVGRGEFDRPLVVHRKDELGDLATEVNAMCDQLATSLEALRHADRLTTVGKLAAGVAHELGTPLNIVRARARLIETAEGETDPARASARIIVEATDRMTRIIRQLLQFARRRGPDVTPGDLRALTIETLELLAPFAKKKEVTVTLAPTDADTRTLLDSAQVQQIVTNLVLNAIQATPEQSCVRVTLNEWRGHAPSEQGGQVGEYLCLAVTDEGPGIAAENLARVFEPFFTTKDVGEGTGLGLSVSYGIAQDHGGWLVAQSPSMGGARFELYLPKRRET